MVIHHHKLANNHGVLVAGIEPDGPAKESGLEERDIIIAFKDAPVTSIDDLHRALVGKEIGVRSTLKIIRGVEMIELPVVPRELPKRD